MPTINLHLIQNTVPNNYNRDDLGAPKTAFFGGEIRARISSQCLKRHIRHSEFFAEEMKGLRTRRLLHKILNEDHQVGENNYRIRAQKALESCGLIKKDAKKAISKNPLPECAMLVFTSSHAIDKMKEAVYKSDSKETASVSVLAQEISAIISEETAAGIALFGRMLEPLNLKGGDDQEGESDTGIWSKPRQVEASVQVAHALSTHALTPEIDYLIAADDVPGADENKGAGYLEEAMFSSACFYKYFSLDLRTLQQNLHGDIDLAKKTALAFLKSAILINPEGKQNSYAAHTLPELAVVEYRRSPVNYANAFSSSATGSRERSLVEDSVSKFRKHIADMDAGYFPPTQRIWFSPSNTHKGVKASKADDFQTSEVGSLCDLEEQISDILAKEIA